MVENLAAQMAIDINRGQKYTLIVGLGLTGLSVARFLCAKGENIVVTDTRDLPPGLVELKRECPDAILMLGKFDEQVFIAANQIVISPGVPVESPEIQAAIENRIDVIGDVELFAREVKAPVVAITGSNGKSTVTTLVGNMARKAGIEVAVGGNIGVPALDLLNQNADLYVLELSSFQLETLFSLKPVAATVLNISADHMDRYQGIDEYARTKARIYEKSVNAIVNCDDQEALSLAAGKDHITGFTLSEPGADDFGLRVIDSDSWLCKGEQKILREDDLKIGGQHNTSNALAALALGEAAGIPMSAMLETLREFPGLPHRTQWVAEKNKVSWFNDSKGTNVGATLAAIEGLKVENKLLLIAGGQAKDADFSLLKGAVQQKVRCLVLIGQDAEKIETDLAGTVPVYHAGSMEEAVAIAASHAESGDAVLLSPACASFDMFSGYEQRGEIFMKAVRNLS